MPSKTRERLIEVAMQLFARKGMENTTMNDIANASERGRRTVYTYFRNKREIANAVIEHESDLRVRALRQIVENGSVPAVQRLRLFLGERCDGITDMRSRRGETWPLLNMFGREMRRTARVRQLACEKELGLLQQLLDDGVAAGEFDRAQAERLQAFMHRLLFGIDLALLSDGPDGTSADVPENPFREQLIDFIVLGLRPQPVLQS